MRGNKVDPSMGRRAYVFYATDRTYAIAVLVFVKRLRQLGIGAGIEVVAPHLPLNWRAQSACSTVWAGAEDDLHGLDCATRFCMEAHWADHVISDPAILAGKPVMCGTRLAVDG